MVSERCWAIIARVFLKSPVSPQPFTKGMQMVSAQRSFITSITQGHRRNVVFTARCYYTQAERGIATASRPSVCTFVCDIEVSWSHWLEYVKNYNSMADSLRVFTLSADPNIHGPRTYSKGMGIIPKFQLE